MLRRPFLIVGPQRSGTSVTHDCLLGHPEVTLTSDEVRVAPLFTRGIATFTCGNESWLQRTRGYRALFDALTLLEQDERTRAHGLKLAVQSGDEAADLAEALREHLRDLHIVHVKRDDLVAQFASLERAQQSGVWHSWQGGSGKTTPRTLDPRSFARHVEETLSVHAQLGALRATHPYLKLGYESEIAAGEFGALFDFLAVERLEPSWLGHKKIARPLEEWIENLAELRRIESELTTLGSPDEAARTEHRRFLALLGETPLALLNRATADLTHSRLDDAERVCFAALARPRAGELRMPRWEFDMLEAIWQQLGSAERARAGLDRLAEGFRDDPRFAVLSGVVLVHSGERAAGFAELERGLQLDPSLERARKLLREWRRSEIP